MHTGSLPLEWLQTVLEFSIAIGHSASAGVLLSRKWNANTIHMISQWFIKVVQTNRDSFGRTWGQCMVNPGDARRLFLLCVVYEFLPIVETCIQIHMRYIDLTLCIAARVFSQFCGTGAFCVFFSLSVSLHLCFAISASLARNTSGIEEASSLKNNLRCLENCGKEFM